MPDLPSLPDLPSMPQLNIPGINLNVDTDRGTASGGIDFHNGTSGSASYGPGGVDFSGQSGNTSLGGHASAPNSWNVHGGTKTQGGTSLAGTLSDDHGAFSGAANLLGAGGDRGTLGGTFGRGATTGFGSYAASTATWTSAFERARTPLRAPRRRCERPAPPGAGRAAVREPAAQRRQRAVQRLASDALHALDGDAISARIGAAESTGGALDTRSSSG